MTAEQKKWWQKVAALTVGGGVVAGGLFGIVRATAEPKKAIAGDVEHAAWTRAAAAPAAPAVAPAVAVIERSAAPVESDIVPAGATIPPIPLPLTAVPGGTPSLPAVPPVPASVGAALPPVPAGPSALPLPTGAEPAAPGPRAADLESAEPIAVPALPAVPELPKVPAAPDVKLPALPAAPITPAGLPAVPVTPAASAEPVTPPAPVMSPGAPPALPPLPGATAEPPKAPPVPTPPAMPGVPVTPQPAGTAPSLLPAKPADPVNPMPTAKPDSGLNTSVPGNTLNPPPVAPAVPIAFPPTSPGGRDVPALPVDLAKPTNPAFGATEKFAFPPNATPSSTPRDPAMLNLKHTAALAVIGGAMLTAENARSATVFPPIAPAAPTGPAAPAVPVKADVETDKLKDDLKKANAKIESLEKQVAKLTELLNGKKDDIGLTLPSDPGAVEEIKRLKNRISELDTEIKSLKTQTSLKPSVTTPEARPEGTVKVVNEYPVEISMVINEKSHRIAPNQVLQVKVPAGDFSYQLLQSGAAATRSVIKDKETVTLRIK